MVPSRPRDAPDLIPTPLKENVAQPVFENATSELQPLLASKPDFPNPTFAFARKDVSGRRLPQAIAHRGYKAKYPENTMGAFKGAVDVGADAVETDVHISRDNVVVLSHDKDLKRCFGREEEIVNCDYEFLSQLKTLKEPHESMPRLVDLLEYVAQPGLEDIWVLLDIKLDNDPEAIMRLIGETIRSVPPSTRPWSSRIVLGIWAAKYLSLCAQHLPGFPITYIGFSIANASAFLKVPNVSFNLLQACLMTPWGRNFIREAHSDKRPVFAWTVNDEPLMKWDIRHQLDGVITDDPRLFLEVRKGWHEGTRAKVGLLLWANVLRLNLMVWFFARVYRTKFGVEEAKSFGRSRATVLESV